jgi:hypothetical protein
MTFKFPLAIALSATLLQVYSAAQAEERREERREGRGRANPPPRSAPPRFQAHPPGAHPHGAIVRPHPIRVLQPTVAKYGVRQWRHWEHPEFSRPVAGPALRARPSRTPVSS